MMLKREVRFCSLYAICNGNRFCNKIIYEEIIDKKEVISIKCPIYNGYLLKGRQNEIPRARF